MTSSKPDNAPILAINLRYLCSFYPSVSAVCKRTGINRQQFNKYLTGRVQPSLAILRRVADFFGLDVEEICFDHESLKQLIESRGRHASLISGALAQQHQFRQSSSIAETIAELSTNFAKSDSGVLKRYCGYYYRYHYAFDDSGRIVRSMFHIGEQQGIFVTKLIERIRHQSNGSQRYTTLKYEGVLMAISGCLFNVEHESIMKSCVGYAAFAHVQRPGQRFILGIQSSFSSSSGKPAASRVVLERAPAAKSFRAMIAECGMFSCDSRELDPDIIDLIANENLVSGKIFSLPAV